MGVAMSKRGRQQSQRGHQGHNQGEPGSGRRQSSNRTSWESNDRSQDPQGGWNDGGIGGGDDRPRRMSGDDSRFDRRESYSGDWDSDDGRATYGSQAREFDRDDFGGRGRRDFGPQHEGGEYGPSPSRYLGRYEQQGDFGRGFDQGRYGGPRYRSEGNDGQAQYGQGSDEQANSSQRNYGQRNYGQGNYSEGQSGQSYYNRREPRPGGSVGSGRSNAGYGEGSTGRGHAGRGPKGYQRSDERIREDVSDSLTDDAEVDASEITVEAHDGEVTLTGTVQTREEKRAAEACAEEVSGVREVINQLRVSRTSSSGESSTGSSSGAGSSGRSPGQSSQSGKASRGSSES